jgi:opacity protein-like surface antigen
MKKFFAVVLLTFLLAGCSHAQTKFAMKGDWEFGGDIGFVSSTPVTGGSTTSGSSSTIFILEPFGGYFVIDNLQIGLLPQFLSVTSPSLYATGTIYKSTNSIFNIFVDPAYYFPLSHKMIYPFIHALAGYSSWSTSSTAPGSSSTSATGFSWGVGAGVKVEVGANSLINLGIDYIQYTFNPSGSSSRNGNNNIQVLVGFTTFLK